MTNSATRRDFLRDAMAITAVTRLPGLRILSDPCSLSQESASGYKSAITYCQREIIIAAGLRTVSLTQLRQLHHRAAAGAWLLWERAATFNNPPHTEADALFNQIFHLRAVAEYSTQHLYVRYDSSPSALVRRIGTLPRFEHPAAQAIATHAGQPCAFRLPIGRGGLLYLGSMLGPHLAADDLSAKTLLRFLLLQTKNGDTPPSVRTFANDT